MLGVMAEISMDLVGNIAITDAVSNIASALIGGNVGGIMQTVTQQLGLGLMLSTLLITVPPMAGAWFNGMMAGFSAYSVIGNGNRQEVPPHLDGGASRQQISNIDKPMNYYQDQYQQPISSYTTGGYGNANQGLGSNTVKPIGQSKFGASQTQEPQ